MRLEDIPEPDHALILDDAAQIVGFCQADGLVLKGAGVAIELPEIRGEVEVTSIDQFDISLWRDTVSQSLALRDYIMERPVLIERMAHGLPIMDLLPECHPLFNNHMAIQRLLYNTQNLLSDMSWGYWYTLEISSPVFPTQWYVPNVFNTTIKNAYIDFLPGLNRSIPPQYTQFRLREGFLKLGDIQLRRITRGIGVDGVQIRAVLL